MRTPSFLLRRLCLHSLPAAFGVLPLTSVVSLSPSTTLAAASAPLPPSLVGNFTATLSSNVTIEPFQLPKNWVRPSAPYQVSLKVDSSGTFSGAILRPDGRGSVPISGILDPVSGWGQGYRCADGKWLFLRLSPQSSGALHFTLAEDSGGYVARAHVMRFVSTPGTYQELMSWDPANPVPTYPDYASTPPELVGKPMPIPIYFGRLTVTATSAGAFSLTMEGLQALERESSPIKISASGAFDGFGQWQKTVTDEKGTQFTLQMKCAPHPGFTASVTVRPKGVKQALTASATFTQPAAVATGGDVSGATGRRYTIALEPGAYVGDGPTYDALDAQDRVVGGYGTLTPIGAGKQWAFTGKLSSGATFSSTCYKKATAGSEEFAVFANGIVGANARTYQLLGKLPLGDDSYFYAYGAKDPRQKGGLFLSTSYLYPRTNPASEFYWGQNFQVGASSWKPDQAGAWNFMNPNTRVTWFVGADSPLPAVAVPQKSPGSSAWSAAMYDPALGPNSPSTGKISITGEGIVSIEQNGKTYSGVWLQYLKCIVGFRNSETSHVWAPIGMLP